MGEGSGGTSERFLTPGTAEPSLYRTNEVRTQVTGGDDGVDRAHGLSSLDVVDLLELRGHLA